MDISFLQLKRNPSFDELYLFFLQLATFYQSGEPIPRALEMIAEDIENTVLKDVLQEMKKALRDGDELSKALSNYSFFPGFCIHAIRAGEESGKLEEALFEVAKDFEQAGDVRRMIQSSLLPVKIIVVFLTIAMGIAITNIIPKFLIIYKDLRLELPLITKIVLGIARFILDYWYIHLLVIGGIAFYFRMFKKKHPEKVDAFLLAVPLYKGVYYYILQYRLAKAYALLRNAGISPITALEITAETVDNAVLARILKKAVRHIRNSGMDVPQALRDSNHDRVIHPVLINFIATGENTGKTGEVLEKIAEYFKKMLAFNLKAFSEKIGPIFLTPMMLLIVGFILSVLYPVLMLSNFGK